MFDSIIDSIYYGENISLVGIENMFIRLSSDTEFGKEVINSLPEFIYHQNFKNSFGDNSIYYSTHCRRELVYIEIIIGDIMFRFDKNDPVADTYQKIRLSEMARFIDKENNPLINNKQSRQYAYYTAKNDPMYAKVNSLVTHKFDGENETMWTTLDHDNHEAVHRSYFVKDTTKTRLPFDHETQESVERTQHPDLPKGYATDVAYNHFLQSKYPLSSSNQQQIGGNKMWQRLAHRAFDDGHHVYLWDNANKTLNHLDTKEKVESGLRYYFTTDPKFKSIDRGHIIISKNAVVTG